MKLVAGLKTSSLTKQKHNYRANDGMVLLCNKVSIVKGLRSDTGGNNMGMVSPKQFQSLTTTTVVDDQLIQQIRELEKGSYGVAELEISKRINSLYFANVGTWATFMGKELISGHRWDARN